MEIKYSDLEEFRENSVDCNVSFGVEDIPDTDDMDDVTGETSNDASLYNVDMKGF